jgi:hypothetical protein
VHCQAETATRDVGRQPEWHLRSGALAGEPESTGKERGGSAIYSAPARKGGRLGSTSVQTAHDRDGRSLIWKPQLETPPSARVVHYDAVYMLVPSPLAPCLWRQSESLARPAAAAARQVGSLPILVAAAGRGYFAKASDSELGSSARAPRGPGCLQVPNPAPPRQSGRRCSGEARQDSACGGCHKHDWDSEATASAGE